MRLTAEQGERRRKTKNEQMNNVLGILVKLKDGGYQQKPPGQGGGLQPEYT